jgi:hypothetical protein
MPGGRPSPLTEELAREYFYGDETLHQAAAKIKTSHQALKRMWVSLYGEDAYQARRTRMKAGEKNPAWKGKPIIAEGYRRVPPPDWWEGPVQQKKSRGARGYIYEHQLVVAETEGLTRIPEGLQIHHIDGDGLNNSPSNLMMVTPAEHRRIHANG